MSNCSYQEGPMTVGDLIKMLIDVAPSMDSRVTVSTLSGNNIIVFAPFDVVDVSVDDEEDEGQVDINTTNIFAFDSDTKKDLETGVLTLE